MVNLRVCNGRANFPTQIIVVIYIFKIVIFNTVNVVYIMSCVCSVRILIKGDQLNPIYKKMFWPELGSNRVSVPGLVRTQRP